MTGKRVKTKKNMPRSKAMNTEKPVPIQLKLEEKVILQQGLNGLDDHFDKLTSLWEQLQLASVDVAHPSLDLFTFSQTAFYLGVISLKPEPKAKPDAKEEDSWFAAPSGFAPPPTFWAASANEPRGLPDVPKSSNDDNTGTKSFEPSGSSVTLFEKPETAERTKHGPPISYSSAQTPAQLYRDSFRDTEAVSEGAMKGAQDVGDWLDDYEAHWQYSTWTDNRLGPGDRYLREDALNTPLRDFPASPPPPVGLVYLTATPLVGGDDQVGELNVGIILDQSVRGHGYAREVLRRVLTMAFEQKSCHRVQAAILDQETKDRALTLFTQMKFGHEGTRRLSFFSPLEGEWKDVTYLALLATDWAIRSSLKPAPKSLWDEMFARHAREREALLRWDEHRMRKLHRTTSMETITAPPPEPSDAEMSGVSGASSPCRTPSPTSSVSVPGDDDFQSDDAESVSSRYSSLPSSPRSASVLSRRSLPRSVAAESEGSTGTPWDMLETSSEDGSMSDFSDVNSFR